MRFLKHKKYGSHKTNQKKSEVVWTFINNFFFTFNAGHRGTFFFTRYKS